MDEPGRNGDAHVRIALAGRLRLRRVGAQELAGRGVQENVRIAAGLLLMFVVGCGVHAADEPTPEDSPAPVGQIDPKVSDAAAQAIQLWNEAAGAEIPVPTRIELADFGTDDAHAAGWSQIYDIIQISALEPPAQRAASIAHELGHSLGLEHDFDTGDLMDPNRPTAARLRPCITAELVAAAGFAGPGACVGE